MAVLAVHRGALAWSLLVLAGCAVMPDLQPYADVTGHYRSSERFERVQISVRAGTDPDAAGPAYRDLPGRVAKELAVYLRGEGIEVVGLDESVRDVARFEITVSGAATRTQRSDFVEGIQIWEQLGAIMDGFRYTLDTRLVGPAGNLIEETTLYHEAGRSSPVATAQQLAMLAADDVLLIWHPQTEVVGRDWIDNKPAPFALLANPDGPPVDGKYQLSWEAFPSERLLAGADFTVTDITGVSYELRLHRSRGFYTEGIMSYLNVPANALDTMFRVDGLTEPSYTFPFALPACAWVVWSARAHFQLRGVPRVTEWSGDYSTEPGNLISMTANHVTIVPPYFYRRVDHTASGLSAGKLEHHAGGGTLIRVDPPAPLRCRELRSKGSAGAPGEGLRIEPIEPGHSIAVIATDNERCAGEDCEVEASLAEASGKIATCLISEFERSGIDIPVHDLSIVLGELPSGSALAAAAMGNAALVDALRLPENRAFLESRGIRYVVSTDMSYQRTGRNWGETSIIGMESSVEYASALQTHIIDVRTGERVGAIGSSAVGQEGQFVPFLLIIPLGVIEYGGRAKIDAKACDAMARRVSFTLRGGASGWPKEYFQDVYAPLWGTTDDASESSETFIEECFDAWESPVRLLASPLEEAHVKQFQAEPEQCAVFLYTDSPYSSPFLSVDSVRVLVGIRGAGEFLRLRLNPGEHRILVAHDSKTSMEDSGIIDIDCLAGGVHFLRERYRQGKYAVMENGATRIRYNPSFLALVPDDLGRSAVMDKTLRLLPDSALMEKRLLPDSALSPSNK